MKEPSIGLCTTRAEHFCLTCSQEPIYCVSENKMVRFFRRPPKSRHGKALHTVIYGHLSTRLQNEGVSRALLCELKGLADKHEADLITGDFKMAAYRGHGKPSSIEEAWGRGQGRWETRLLALPEVVPKWGQIQETGDCCGFIRTTKNKEEAEYCTGTGAYKQRKAFLRNKLIKQHTSPCSCTASARSAASGATTPQSAAKENARRRGRGRRRQRKTRMHGTSTKKSADAFIGGY